MSNRNPRAEAAAEAAAWAESDERQVRPDATPLRGADAVERSRALLAEAADGDPDSEQLLVRVAGRPSLGAKAPTGASPMWKVRAPADLDAAARDRAEAEGRRLSELIRDAVTRYLAVADERDPGRPVSR